MEKLTRKRLSEVIGDASGIYDMCIVDETEGGVKILVPNKFLREYIREHTAGIEEKIGKKIVAVEIDESAKELSPSEESAEAVQSRQTLGVHRWGVLYGDSLNHGMTPENYIVASNNRAAVAAAKSLISELLDAGFVQNGSLTIYGISGVGKTHLLHSVGWAVLEAGRNVAYLKSYSLISLVLEAFKNKSANGLLTEFDRVDLLLIDDFQHFATSNVKKSVKDFLFSLIDSMISAGKAVMVTSDVYPDKASWKSLDERIRQRVVLRGAVRIDPPNSEFVKTFMTVKLMNAGFSITEDALSSIEKLEFSSVRNLDQLVHLVVSRMVERGKSTVEVEDIASILNSPHSVCGITKKMEIKPKSNLKKNWINFVEAVVEDALLADKLIKGENLLDEEKELHTLLRNAFCYVHTQNGTKLISLARLFGVSVTAVSQWLKKTEVALATKTKNYSQLRLLITTAEELIKQEGSEGYG